MRNLFHYQEVRNASKDDCHKRSEIEEKSKPDGVRRTKNSLHCRLDLNKLKENKTPNKGISSSKLSNNSVVDMETGDTDLNKSKSSEKNTPSKRANKRDRSSFCNKDIFDSESSDIEIPSSPKILKICRKNGRNTKLKSSKNVKPEDSLGQNTLFSYVNKSSHSPAVNMMTANHSSPEVGNCSVVEDVLCSPSASDGVNPVLEDTTSNVSCPESRSKHLNALDQNMTADVTDIEIPNSPDLFPSQEMKLEENVADVNIREIETSDQEPVCKSTCLRARTKNLQRPAENILCKMIAFFVFISYFLIDKITCFFM